MSSIVKRLGKLDQWISDVMRARNGDMRGAIYQGDAVARPVQLLGRQRLYRVGIRCCGIQLRRTVLVGDTEE